MKKNLICTTVLFSCLSLCTGCENKQKKDNRIVETTTQAQADSVNPAALYKEDILSWDYDQAIDRLGEPVCRDSFRMIEANGISVGLHKILSQNPADTAVLVRELTFKADKEIFLTIAPLDRRDSAQLKDMHLSIWYVEKDGQWKPVNFLKYSITAQY